MEEIIYKKGERKRPVNSRYVRILYFLMYIPFIRIAWAPVSIGERCSFSFNNIIITSTHDLNDFSTVIGRSVTIGNNKRN